MEEPLRYQRTFGLNAEQLDELEARIEDALPEPWDKGTGLPKGLSLREAIMVTLLYERQNMIEEVIADFFGISQGTVSNIITEFTPPIARATERSGHRGVPAGCGGSQGDDPRSVGAGGRHVVAVLIMGRAPTTCGPGNTVPPAMEG